MPQFQSDIPYLSWLIMEPGVLARVVGLFSGRGYNIESLTVSEVDEARHQSRISVVTSGTPMVIEQIKTLLARLVPVHSVQDLTVALLMWSANWLWLKLSIPAINVLSRCG